MKHLFLVIAIIVIGTVKGDAISEALNPSMDFIPSSQEAWTTATDSYSDGNSYLSNQTVVRSQSTSSALEAWITTTVSGPGKIAFKWKGNGSRSLLSFSFWIDGVSAEQYDNYYNWDEIEKKIFTSGQKTLKWIWNKPSGYSSYYGSIYDVRWIPAPSSFVVKFNPCGGTLQSGEKTYSCGDTYGAMPTPTKSGCTFDGWYTMRHGGKKLSATDFADWDVAEVYAHWSGGSVASEFDGISTSVVVNDSSKWSSGNGLMTIIPEYDEWSGEGEQIDNWIEAQIEGEGILSFTWLLSAVSTSQWANVDANIEILVDGEPVLVKSGDEASTSENMFMELDEGECGAYFGEEGECGEVFRTASVYLTPGVHAVKWRVSQYYCQGMEAYVSIGDLKFEPVGNQSSIVDMFRIVDDYNIWRPDNMKYLSEEVYGPRITENPDDYEARILRAATKLGMLLDNDKFREIANNFGYSVAEYTFTPTGEFVGLEKAPLSNDVIDELMPEILASVDSALEDILAIPTDWTGRFEIKPENYGGFSVQTNEYWQEEKIYAGLAEVSMLRAGIEMLRAQLKLAEGYDYEADYLAVSNAAESAESVYEALAAVPKAGSIRKPAALLAAKEDFRAALQSFKRADAAIMNRGDYDTYLFEYDLADAEEIEECRKILDQVIASLDTTNTVDFTYFGEKYDTNGVAQAKIPGGEFAKELFLGAIYAGKLTRDLVPNGPIDVESGDVHMQMQTIPDPTIGGLLPWVTLNDIARYYPQTQEWSLPSYMANDPEITLWEGKELIVTCKASRSADLSWTALQPGMVSCYRDGVACIESTRVGSDPVAFSVQAEQGQEYSLRFMPDSRMTNAVSVFSITEAPVALLDGGPYTETVNGVEWTFMVENGCAVLGSEYDPAVLADTAGEIEIPEMLGGNPVTAIGVGAFAWCSSLTSIVIPASVTIIDEDVFYRASGLEALKFLGNEPAEIGDGAFDRIGSGCSVYVTRASTWNVAVPGTWQGMEIAYVPGYNPAITVSVNAESGTRFDGSHSVELTAGANQTIYYTVDGSDPRSSSTRQAYTGAFELTETTTVTYCAIDDATGDWSENYTATYRLIVRMPDGGPYTQTIDGIAWMYRVENGLAILDGIDTSNMSADWQPSGVIEIPSVLGERPVVSIFSIGFECRDQIKKISIPNSITNIENTAFCISPSPFPAVLDDETYPGFLAVDGWIVARNPDVMSLPLKVDLGSARGIARMVCIADENVEEIVLPTRMNRITMDLGLSEAMNLKRLEIPDSVRSVEVGSFPFHDYWSANPLFDTKTYPSFVAIDGWICEQWGDGLDPVYCDLSGARGICEHANITGGGGATPIRVEALILPNVFDLAVNIGGLFGVSQLYIPEGVSRIDKLSIFTPLTELYLPRSVKELGTAPYMWCNNLSVLYLPDTLRTKIESYDEQSGGRPIDMMQNNTRPGFKVVYYSTRYYQHTLSFDTKGGRVTETSRKVDRGFLPAPLPVPVRPGFVFAGWSYLERRKDLFDTSRIVLSDMTLYAMWEEVSAEGVLSEDGRLVLSSPGIEPVGSVVLPVSVDGRPVEIIGRDFMKGAVHVTAVQIPSTATEIRESAFRECSRLETVTLPEGLLSIADNAFRECVSLKSVTIPPTVTNIGYFAFRDCLRLENVTLMGEVPRQDLGVFMGVPAFTTVSGRLGSATAIVYAVVTNATPEIDVPEAWLDELAVMHDKPAGADSYQAAFAAKFGSDLSAALTKPTGKFDLKGNPLYVWQDYVAGTDPLDEEDQFTATLTMEDGVPVVSWSPELPPEQAARRKYTVYGATALNGEWVDVSAKSDAERHAQGYQFFRVSVELR